jgi:hypothetical protein
VVRAPVSCDGTHPRRRAAACTVHAPPGREGRALRAACRKRRLGGAAAHDLACLGWPAWAGYAMQAPGCATHSGRLWRRAGWAQIGGCGAAVRPGRSPPIPRRFCITPPRHVQLVRRYLVITPPRHVQLLEERTSDGGVRLTLGVDDGEGCEALAHVPRGGLQLGGADHQLGALDLHALPHGWHALVTVGSGGRTSFYVNGRLQGSVPRQVAPSPGPSPGPGPS